MATRKRGSLIIPLDMREALYALVEYAGPLDDPRIGWAGGIKPPSQDEFLRCERCGHEAIADTDIEHAECEAAECERASAMCQGKARYEFLRNCC